MRTRKPRDMYLWQVLTSLLVTLISGAAFCSEPLFFRIGTGGATGTYFPIGQLIAEAISTPKTPYNTLGIAQLSNGSVANVRDLDQHRLEAGLVQADIAFWAYNGAGPFADEEPSRTFRSVATLYPETLHLVADTRSDIHVFSDLAGKRVAIDEPGSGTLIDVTLVLNAYRLAPSSFEAAYLKPADAVERLLENQLDAFFIIAGDPISLVADLLASGRVRLIPLSGPPIDQLVRQKPFFTKAVISADSYPNQPEIQTLAVRAQLMVRADLDRDLVYQITAQLWRPETLYAFAKGHPKGRKIRLDTALKGLSVPLHAGAARYYKQAGVLTLPTDSGSAQPRPNSND